MLVISTLIDELKDIEKYTDILDDNILTTDQYIQQIIDILNINKIKLDSEYNTSSKLLNNLISNVGIDEQNKTFELSDKEINDLIDEIVGSNNGNYLVIKIIDYVTDLINIRNEVIKFVKKYKIAEAQHLITFQTKNDNLSDFIRKMQVMHIGLKYAIENQDSELFKFFIQNSHEHIKYITYFNNHHNDIIRLENIIVCWTLQHIVEATNTYSLSNVYAAKMLDDMFSVFSSLNFDFDPCITRCKLRFETDKTLVNALNIVINSNKVVPTLELLKIYNGDNTKLKVFNNNIISVEIMLLLKINDFVNYQCCNSSILQEMFSFESSINLLQHKLPYKEFYELKVAANSVRVSKQIHPQELQTIKLDNICDNDSSINNESYDHVKLLKKLLFRSNSYKLQKGERSNNHQEVIVRQSGYAPTHEKKDNYYSEKQLLHEITLEHHYDDNTTFDVDSISIGNDIQYTTITL